MRVGYPELTRDCSLSRQTLNLYATITYQQSYFDNTSSPLISDVEQAWARKVLRYLLGFKYLRSL